MRQNVTGALVMMLLAVTSCGGAAADETESTSTASPTPGATAQDPDIGATTTSGATDGDTTSGDGAYLDDRTTLTQNDTGAQFNTVLGNRIELQLSNDWTWTQPRVSGPVELVEINFITDPGYLAWELLIKEPGTITIDATGTAVCDACDNTEFTVTIAVK